MCHTPGEDWDFFPPPPKERPEDEAADFFQASFRGYHLSFAGLLSPFSQLSFPVLERPIRRAGSHEAVCFTPLCVPAGLFFDDRFAGSASPFLDPPAGSRFDYGPRRGLHFLRMTIIR